VQYDSLVKKILKRESVSGEVNIVFVDDKKIRELNKKYRHKDKATDVLSFEMNEEGIVGDIAISTETTKANAKKYGVTYEVEVRRLIIHGVLHLLGYDHGKEMRNAEKICQKF